MQPESHVRTWVCLIRRFYNCLPVKYRLKFRIPLTTLLLFPRLVYCILYKRRSSPEIRRFWMRQVLNQTREAQVWLSTFHRWSQASFIICQEPGNRNISVQMPHHKKMNQKRFSSFRTGEWVCGALFLGGIKFVCLLLISLDHSFQQLKKPLEETLLPTSSPIPIVFHF